MDNNIYTIKLPVTKSDNIWTPKYNLDGMGLPKSQFKRHYKIEWYKKGFWKFHFQNFLSRFNLAEKPISCKMHVEVAIKNCPDEIKQKLLLYPDVELIETPEAYKF